MKHRVCTRCGSDKYYCKGLCKLCYNKQLVLSKWSKKFDCCINCKSFEFPHIAHGLCRRCYQSQPTKNLCTCGCGLTVPKVGNIVRKYRKGHWMKNNQAFMNAHTKAMTGENNPQYGKFGKEHPAYGHKTTKKVREERRQRRLKALSTRSTKPTDIEIILSNLLDEMKINHKSQTLMYNKFSVDEYIPKYDLIIEAYGGYWHGDKRKFTRPSHLQSKNQSLDKTRAKYLNKCGHRVLILWENELKTNIEYCKKEILSAIKNSGIPLTQNILN